MFKYDPEVTEYLQWATFRLQARETVLKQSELLSDEDRIELHRLEKVRAALQRVVYNYRYWFDTIE